VGFLFCRLVIHFRHECEAKSIYFDGHVTCIYRHMAVNHCM